MKDEDLLSMHARSVKNLKKMVCLEPLKSTMTPPTLEIFTVSFVVSLISLVN